MNTVADLHAALQGIRQEMVENGEIVPRYTNTNFWANKISDIFECGDEDICFVLADAVKLYADKGGQL